MRVVLRLFIASLIATAISAVDVTHTASAAPLPLDEVRITVHTEQGTNVLLVSGTLPAGTKLPARVELAVPSGELQWAGEILGGDPAQDPQVAYTVRKGETNDVYSFTLTKSLTGQVEIVSPSVVVFEGTAYRSALTWTPASDVKSLTMSVRMPAGSQVSSTATGATVVPGAQGYSYYQRIVSDVKAGQTESLAFAYVPGATGTSGAAGAAPGSGGGYLPVMIGFAAVLGFAFLLFRNVRRPMRNEAEEGNDDGEDTEDDTEEDAASEAFDLADEEAVKATATPAGKAKPKPPAANASSAKQTSPPKPRANQKVVILGVVAAVIGVFVVVSMLTSRGATQSGDTVSMTVAQVDTCTAANIALTAPAGANLAKDAESILEKLRYVSGVGDGTIRISTSTLTVNYCSSNTTEELIRQAIVPTGYLASAAVPGSGSATATPAGPSAQ